MKTRHALERSQCALKHWPSKPPKDQNDPTQWSQEVRWGVIVHGLRSQARGAAHADDVTKDFVYDRSDAISSWRCRWGTPSTRSLPGFLALAQRTRPRLSQDLVDHLPVTTAGEQTLRLAWQMVYELQLWGRSLCAGVEVELGRRRLGERTLAWLLGKALDARMWLAIAVRPG
jgi:hypothetical protein